MVPVVPKFLNPILCYYIDDRIFTYEDGKITYKLLFNNQITKFEDNTMIDRKRKFIEFRWGDYIQKEGIGSPQHLLAKLEASGNKEQYELGTLIRN